jgi:hypothetical protein
LFDLSHRPLPSTRLKSKFLDIMVVPLQEIIDNIYRMLSRMNGGSSFDKATMIQCKPAKRPWEV